MSTPIEMLTKIISEVIVKHNNTPEDIEHLVQDFDMQMQIDSDSDYIDDGVSFSDEEYI